MNSILDSVDWVNFRNLGMLIILGIYNVWWFGTLVVVTKELPGIIKCIFMSWRFWEILRVVQQFVAVEEHHQMHWLQMFLCSFPIDFCIFTWFVVSMFPVEAKNMPWWYVALHNACHKSHLAWKPKADTRLYWESLRALESLTGCDTGEGSERSKVSLRYSLKSFPGYLAILYLSVQTFVKNESSFQWTSRYTWFCRTFQHECPPGHFLLC